MARDTELRFLRYLPGETVVHRLWAGTKILAVGAVSLALSLRPTWRSLAIVGVIVDCRVDRGAYPRGAAPRIPAWIVTVLVMGGLVSVMWGPAPHRRILGVQVSTTAADQWTRLLLVGVELLTLAAVVGWTTRLGDLAAALRKLLRPLRVLRVPSTRSRSRSRCACGASRCWPRSCGCCSRRAVSARSCGRSGSARRCANRSIFSSRRQPCAYAGAASWPTRSRRGAGSARSPRAPADRRVVTAWFWGCWRSPSHWWQYWEGDHTRTGPAAVTIAVRGRRRHRHHRRVEYRVGCSMPRPPTRSTIQPANRPTPIAGQRNGSVRRARCSRWRAAAGSRARRGAELRAPPHRGPRTGINLGTESCYRPLAGQIAARGNACGNGNCACAATISSTATVGTSYHGWGKAVDLTVDGNSLTDPNSPRRSGSTRTRGRTAGTTPRSRCPAHRARLP